MKYFNILIVEDDWINAKYIKRTVEALGHSVISIVDNANDALKIAQTKDISLVFMDININGSIDGIECAKSLNKNIKIPIIYLTAYSDTKTLDEVSMTNIYGFVAKPYTSKDIEIALNTVNSRITQEEKTVLTDNNLINLNNGYVYNKKLKSLKIDEKLEKLTNKESLFLYLLATNINNIVQIEVFNRELWNNEIKADSTLRDLVSRLRKKMPLAKIENIHGIGYILKK